MISLCLDTNTYSDYARGAKDALAVVEAAEQIWMPVVVLGELRAGFLKGSRGAANEFALTQFLGHQHVAVASIGATTTQSYALLIEASRAQGRPIPANDVWIAAIALELGCPLFTYDQHFQQLPGLSVVSSPEDWMRHEQAHLAR
jgi:tRNA(fMet)-specific endonuclease VapC